MEQVIARIREFRQVRDWEKFHTPENLAKSIAIEAGELLEHFQWDNSFNPEEVGEELADVMIYCIHMADCLGVEIKDIMEKKMMKNEVKYPVDKVKGISTKYTKLE